MDIEDNLWKATEKNLRKGDLQYMPDPIKRLFALYNNLTISIGKTIYDFKDPNIDFFFQRKDIMLHKWSMDDF